MAETKRVGVEFVLTAQDNASGVIARTEENVRKARQAANLPEMGPLTRRQSAVESGIFARQQAMATAAEKAQIQAQIDRAIGGRTASEQAARNARAAELRAMRNARPDFSGMAEPASPFSFGRPKAVTERAVATPRLSEQAERFNKIFSLFGGTMVADRLGRALQGIPEVAEKFRENLKTGYTKTEAMAVAMADMIPGIGELAKGLRSFGDWLNESAFDRQKREQREQDKATSEARLKTLEDRRAKRAPIAAGINEATASAEERAQLLGKTGTARELQEQQIRTDRALKEIEDRRRIVSNWGEEGKPLLEGLAAQRQVVLDEQVQKEKEIRDKINAQMADADAENAAQVKQIDAERGRDQLEQGHRFHAARLKQIDDEAAAQTDALRRAFEKEKRDNPDFIEGDAKRALDREAGAIEARRKREARKAQEEFDAQSNPLGMGVIQSEKWLRAREMARGILEGSDLFAASGPMGISGASHTLRGITGRMGDRTKDSPEELARKQKDLTEQIVRNTDATAKALTDVAKAIGGNGLAIITN